LTGSAPDAVDAEPGYLDEAGLENADVVDLEVEELSVPSA
jgi:hypothetical protein